MQESLSASTSAVGAAADSAAAALPEPLRDALSAVKGPLSAALSQVSCIGYTLNPIGLQGHWSDWWGPCSALPCSCCCCCRLVVPLDPPSLFPGWPIFGRDTT